MNGSGFNIYIVDDDREVRRSLAFMLAAAGRPSRTYAGARAFLAELDALAPGLVLVDLRMGEMGGLDLVAELKRRRAGWPMVVMTGHGEVALAVRALKLGAIDFLEKPFAWELLHACLVDAERNLLAVEA